MTQNGKLLGITQAAKRLGIHPLTLRSWADKGHISFYRTPGGHRRFRQADLDAFLSKMNEGSKETALVMAAREAVQNAIAALPEQSKSVVGENWTTDMSYQQRHSMRTIGRKLLGLVIQYVSGNADEAVLNGGREIGRTYGQFAGQTGMSISQTVSTFNFFRDTIIEVTFESQTEAGEIDTTNPLLYRRLNHFMNEVLLATVQAIEESRPELGFRP